MTDKPTPTDAELEALLLDKLPASKHYIRPVIEKMVAAMQAAIDKWGRPAQAAEPFCWHWENTFNGGMGAVKKNPETLGINMAHPDYKWTALYTAPQPTQTQPVAREPLTYEQIQDLLLCGNPTDEEMRLIRIGWDAARGIKGVQQ